MKERVKFVLEWEKRWSEGEEQLNFAELCRDCGILWIGRYRGVEQSLDVLEIEALLVSARKLHHPAWGEWATGTGPCAAG